jgi:hypothetical protein
VISSQFRHIGGSTGVYWVGLVMHLLPRVFTPDIYSECCNVRSLIGLELVIVLVFLLRDLGGVLDTRKEIYLSGA